MDSLRSTETKDRTHRWQRLLLNATLVVGCGKIGFAFLPDCQMAAAGLFAVAFICIFFVIDDLNWYVIHFFNS